MDWREEFVYDISSRRETERRNEMLLKAAFIQWIEMLYI